MKELVMRKYAMIAAGGFWGAILRFFIRTLEISTTTLSFPINTLLINILGSLMLGYFITVAKDTLKLGEAERVGIISGFLGAFTTFSAISKEVNFQLTSGDLLTAGIYLALSVILGLAAVFVGISLGDRLAVKKKKAD
jgi:CrcB protein